MALSPPPDAHPKHRAKASAFAPHSPIPPVLICQDEIRSSRTGVPLYMVTRDAAVVTVKRKVNGQTLGTIRFRDLSTDDIELTVNGRQTQIHTGLVRNRMRFQSTVSGEKWYWKNDRTTGGVRLEDSKRGNVLARVDAEPSNLLTFDETGTLENASYDEVLLSAVATMEAGKRLEAESPRSPGGGNAARGRHGRASFSMQKPRTRSVA